jgi:predicted ATPase/signal transduction histidine kinase
VNSPSGHVLGVLREGSEFTLLRGRRLADSLAILAVTPNSGQQGAASLKRLEHEFALAGELDSEWAVRPIDLLRHDGRITLILEDPGGHPLDTGLQFPLEIAVFLRIAVGLAEALRQVHSRGLVHRDIKPENLFVDESCNVRITGFSKASRLPRERQVLSPPESITGTFAYMAPEQTGRMNRSMDARSDLYSMGVTLYEMVTGVLPFVAKDPMEWIHSHIARQATPPSGRINGIPKPVEGIIVKLLAKNAQDRYQTAVGVQTDLKRCLEAWESSERIDAFTLGENDGLDRLLIPEKLYGRESDISALLGAFDRVVRFGTMEFVLVSGYSGVGKSSVVNELHKALVPRRGLFASGKFDQFKRGIPYATLAQSLQSLVGQILGQSDADVARWRKALRDALGQNAQLIVNLVPQIELIIGKQPPVQELSPRDAQSRFQTVFWRFIEVFAQAEHPLALFLDDLQWIDTATLDLLQHMVTHSEVRNLLLIGAYRDNEVGSTHPLTRTLAEINKAKAPVHHIALANLVLGDVTRLIADTLRCGLDHARPLAQLVHAKTGGNPFFAIQFIAALEHEGLLAFAAGEGIWVWNVGQIGSKGFTENVVDLMVAKLGRLPATVRNALKQLACMGNSARVANLTAVYGETREVLDAALWEAVRLELVSSNDDSYSFIHDRIQEAAYALIPEADRAPVHLRIGRVLASHSSVDETDEFIFEIVNQFNRGATLITTREERQQVARLNLIAGRRAKASTAYASALRYFAGGRSLLECEVWKSQYRLTFDLELLQAECEFLTGDPLIAEGRLSDLAGRAENLIDLAAVTRIRMALYTTLFRIDRAVEVGLEYLLSCSVKWSPHPTNEDVSEELDRMRSLIGERSIEDLVDLPIMIDPVCLATMEVLAELEAPANFSDSNLFHLVLLRMTNFSLEHGNCDASAFAYASLNVILGLGLGDYRTALRFGQLGYDLVENRGLDRFKARVFTCFATFVLPWTSHLPKSQPLLRRAFHTANAVGDLTFAVLSSRSVVTNLMIAGESLVNVQHETLRALAFARKAQFGLAVATFIEQLISLRDFRGRESEVVFFEESGQDEQWFRQYLEDGGPALAVAASWYWIHKIQSRIIACDYKGSIEAVKKATDLLWATRPYLETAEYHFYGALALAAACDYELPETRDQHLVALVGHHDRLSIWAKSCPENFANRQSLVAAEIARLEGRLIDAELLYEAAIRSARENGYIQNEAIANEIAGRFYAARGITTIANAYLREARICYARWGAEGKVRQLDQSHPQLNQAVASPEYEIAAPTSVDHLDLGTVVKVMQAVSGEIDFKKLIETLMTLALQTAGADRGLLILHLGGELQIEAEAKSVGVTIDFELRKVPANTNVPESILRYVVRTQDAVILDNALEQNDFSSDPYIGRTRCRSILCLPLTKQTKLIGILYLENREISYAFTPARIGVLRLLASQAAISLENARLYADLKSTEARLQTSHDEMQMLVSVIENSDDFIGCLPAKGRDGYINAGGRRMVGVDLDADISEYQISDLRPAEEDQRYFEEILPALMRDGRWIGERNLRHFKTNAPIPVLQNLFYIIDKDTGEQKGVASICKDLSEQRRADEVLRKAQADLELVAQRMTMGELAASIAHELNQPLMAIVTSAETCLLWLEKDRPEIDKARRAAERVVRNGHRAGEVIKSVRALLQKSTPEIRELDLNRTIRDVLDLARTKIRKDGILLETNFSGGLTLVMGDRVQLQQAILNLVMNGIEAMADVTGRDRLLCIKTEYGEDGKILIVVEDSGTGLDPAKIDNIYDAFFTTKPEGMGMGLAICRSIVEVHGGQLWASPRLPYGTTFQFTLPAATGGPLL